MFAAHFLLYNLVYDESYLRVCQNVKLVVDMFAHDSASVMECVGAVLSSSRDFPRHFADISSQLLLDPHAVDTKALNVIKIVSSFVQVAPITFGASDMVDGYGLAPDIMLASRRQICCSRDRANALRFIIAGLHTLK